MAESKISDGGGALLKSPLTDGTCAELSVDDHRKLLAHIREILEPGESSVSTYEFKTDAPVKLQILVLPPTSIRSCSVLTTIGMSSKPMNSVTNGAKPEFAELYLCLPKAWPTSVDVLKAQPQYSWPVQQLRDLAFYPHKHGTSFSVGHTVRIGSSSTPLAPFAKFSAFIFGHPYIVPDRFKICELDRSRIINFLPVIPIYEDEHQLAVREGSAVLLKLLRDEGVSELIDVERSSVAG